MREVVVVSDLHIARLWDKIKKVYPDDYLNPNQNFRDFVKTLREDQLLVLNGDLVDYHYADYKKETETNWDIFYDILKESKAEPFVTLGNHDYREQAVNLSFTGLNHVQIPRSKYKKYKQVIGYNTFREFQELDSILVNFKHFNPLTKLKTPRYFSRNTKERLMLFLDTGPDAFTKFRNFLPHRWPLIFSKHAASAGIDTEQLEFIKTHLMAPGQKNVLIFMHCPPFATKRTSRNVVLGRLAYGWRLFFARLNFGTFLKNNWPFVKIMLDCDKNITLVTGHTHVAKQYLLDKRSNVVHQTDVEEINELLHDERHVKILGTLPLGAIRTADRKIGYLTIGDHISYTVLKDYSKSL